VSEIPAPPDPAQDAEYMRLRGVWQELKAAGASATELRRATMRMGQRKMRLNAAWRRTLPKEERAAQASNPGAGGISPVDGEDIQKSISIASQASPRVVQILLRMIEAAKCTCCKSCTVPRPDMKAVSLLMGILSDGIKLETARLEQRKGKREKEVHEIGWASDGDQT
jgi:hypothetical protein